MKISEMIEVLQAAERGEKIEYKTYLASAPWMPWHDGKDWCFDRLTYRIAPKQTEVFVAGNPKDVLAMVELMKEMGECLLHCYAETDARINKRAAILAKYKEFAK